MRRFGVGLVLSLLLLGACGEDDPAPGEFGASCNEDGDCNYGLVCFAFGMGKQCTMTCPANPDDCPGESSGCNEMGYCKTK